MTINILSEKTIAQIAAGEVVERPASVVKELIENALDAEANNIHVEVRGGGRNQIRISDDGSGIRAEDVELAFASHTTSKLLTIDDLSHIRTLGFRGEALSSIASVSQINLTTRHREEPMGRQLRTADGKTSINKPVGAPIGTVISVENLFYNTPARLKFLKKETTEKRHITALITRYAMAYPYVRFTLEQDGRELFRSSGSGQLSDVLVKTIGLDNFKQMLEFSVEDHFSTENSIMRIWGYTSSPEYTRSDRSHIILFVNGRWVQDTKLTYAVLQAYHSLMPDNRFPVAVVMIEVSPEEVDVNVHPTKAEVRFRDPNAVFSTLQRGVRQTLISGKHRPETQNKRAMDSFFTESNVSRNQWGSGNRLPQFDMDLPTLGNPASSQGDVVDPTVIPDGLGRPLKPRTLPVLRVIGQIGAMYIVTEGPAGMYLVDQYAAHKRVLYEQILKDYVNQNVPVYTLSQTFDIVAEDEQLIEKYRDGLMSLGIHLEVFGPKAYIVRSLPQLLANSDPLETILYIISGLKNHQSIENEIMIRICHQAAIKSGHVLNHDEMKHIIRQLERCESPLICPEGKPTLIHISGDQLAREFKHQ